MHSTPCSEGHFQSMGGNGGGGEGGGEGVEGEGFVVDGVGGGGGEGVEADGGCDGGGDGGEEGGTIPTNSSMASRRSFMASSSAA